jgi:hypothetical protein
MVTKPSRNGRKRKKRSMEIRRKRNLPMKIRVPGM